MKSITRVVVAGIGSFLLLVAVAHAGTRTVKCNSNGALNSAISKAKPGDTLLVSGFCNENISIGAELSQITLDGQGNATVNGPDANANTINVRGRGITVRGFTITGGSRGIFVSRRAEATIDGNH